MSTVSDSYLSVVRMPMLTPPPQSALGTGRSALPHSSVDLADSLPSSSQRPSHTVEQSLSVSRRCYREVLGQSPSRLRRRNLRRAAQADLFITSAGETANPRRNIPRVIKRVFARILIFYILTVIIIGFNVPSVAPPTASAVNHRPKLITIASSDMTTQIYLPRQRLPRLSPSSLTKLGPVNFSFRWSSCSALMFRLFQLLEVAS